MGNHLTKNNTELKQQIYENGLNKYNSLTSSQINKIIGSNLPETITKQSFINNLHLQKYLLSFENSSKISYPISSIMFKTTLISLTGCIAPIIFAAFVHYLKKRNPIIAKIFVRFSCRSGTGDLPTSFYLYIANVFALLCLSTGLGISMIYEIATYNSRKRKHDIYALGIRNMIK